MHLLLLYIHSLANGTLLPRPSSSKSEGGIKLPTACLPVTIALPSANNTLHSFGPAHARAVASPRLLRRKKGNHRRAKKRRKAMRAGKAATANGRVSTEARSCGIPNG